MTHTTPTTQVLVHAINQGDLSTETIASLIRLEQFILHGVSSFGGTSIVIQGRGVNATMTRHRDLYVAMVKELQGDEAAQKAIEKGAPGFPIVIR